MAEEVRDHVICAVEGFFDFGKYPEILNPGDTATVTRQQYILMKGSDPSVELVRIQPPTDILKRIVQAARDEVAAEKEQVADPEVEWKPVGWYKAQLMKNGGMDEAA